MKMYVKFAWRNLWRNKRRTIITAASIFFGVIFAAVMSSMQEGTYSSNIENIVRFYTGYAQLQHPDYWDEKTMEHHIAPSDSLIQEIKSDPRIIHVTPRLESFALASHKDATKVATVVGMAPRKEKDVTNILSNISKGSYLEKGDKGVLVGKLLAKNLGLGVGDTITLTGQGYRYATAAGLFPIKGLIDFPSPELNKRFIYMSLQECQRFYTAPGLLTSLVLMINDNEKLEAISRDIDQKVGKDYTVMTWKDMQPALDQQIQSDRASGVIFKAILYMIIFFGILGTIMMMIAERKRELGVMMAVGMKRFRLAAVILAETLFIGLLGVVAGIAGSIPVNLYFYHNPIPLTGEAAEAMAQYGWEPYMFFSLAPEVFWKQAITIFVLVLVVSVYPLVTIYRMKEIDALRA
ncbi:MAG: ABC transporter permease [Bacteroidales bacterium]|nr:ABC transporter permease [Bacteroidales bacterium]